jgi:hypothetical protein
MILKPHFLRRLKEEVEDSIPPLNETVVEVGNPRALKASSIITTVIITARKMIIISEK